MENCKEVFISIHSIHDCDCGEPDITDFSTDGLYSIDNGEHCLQYFESEVIGVEGNLTTVKITEEQVTVERVGVMNSTLVLREGSREDFVYPTPYGTVTMKVETRKIRHSFDGNGGTMEIEYIISLEHVRVTRNRLQIKVTEIKDIGGWINE